MKRRALFVASALLTVASVSPVLAEPRVPTRLVFGPDAVERARLHALEHPGTADCTPDPGDAERLPEWTDANRPFGDAFRGGANNGDQDGAHYARGHTLIVHVFIDHDNGTWDGSEKFDAGGKAELAKELFLDLAPASANMHFDNDFTFSLAEFTVDIPFAIPDSGMTNFYSDIALTLAGFGDDDGDGAIIDDATQVMQLSDGGYDHVIFAFQPADIMGRAFASYEYSRCVLYTSSSWRTWAHEWGHSFGSCDEYEENGSCGGGMNCGPCQGEYLTTPADNLNCEWFLCGPSVDCLMKDNDETFCGATEAHWAWRDSNADGMLDRVKRRVIHTSFAEVWELPNNGWLLWNQTTDGMSYSQATRTWSAAGLRSSPASNDDLWLYGEDDHRHELASSTRLSGVDFVVGDYNHSKLGNEHLQVSRVVGFGDYTLNWESGTGMLLPDGVWRAGGWAVENVVRTWDVPLFGGEQVTFLLESTSGNLDLGMALFDSNGATYFTSRTGAAWERDAAGPGGSELWTYTVPSDDVYGLVIWTNAAAAGSFRIRIGPTVVALLEETPSFSGAPLALHTYSPNAPAWSVVGVRPAGSTTNASLRLFGDASYTNELAHANLAPGVEFIAVDYGSTAQQPGWTRSARLSGPGALTTEWEHGLDEIDGIETGAWGSTHVVKVWDAFVEGGTEYFLRGYHDTTLDAGLYLFRPNAIPYRLGIGADRVADSNPASAGGEWLAYEPAVNARIGIVQIMHSSANGNYQNWWGPRVIKAPDVEHSRSDEVVWEIHAVPSGNWAVFGVRASHEGAARIALHADEACSPTQQLAADMASDGGVHYIVGDLTEEPPGFDLYYSRRWFDGEAQMEMEWEGGDERIDEVLDATVEITGSWPQGDVCEIWDLKLIETRPDHEVTISIQDYSGEMDFSIGLYRKRDASSFMDRDEALFYSDGAGPGGTESITYTVHDGDVYGLVVTNANERGGDFVIRVGPPGAVDAPLLTDTVALQLTAGPNPSRGPTELRFGIPRAGRGSLDIYDVAGRRVRTLVEGGIDSGMHHRTWDGRDDAGRSVAAGVYLVRLQTPDGERTMRLVRSR